MVADLPFGIDFGGTGIKGAPVDLDEGEFAAERERIRTPSPSTPEAVAEVFVDLLGRFPGSKGPVGVTVPGVVRHGVVHSAANIDEAWIGTDADRLFTDATGRDVHVVNDADAAAWRRRGTAPPRVAPGWSSSPLSGPASAPPWSTTASWSPTPSSATSRSTATTRSPARPTAQGSARSSR